MQRERNDRRKRTAIRTLPILVAALVLASSGVGSALPARPVPPGSDLSFDGEVRYEARPCPVEDPCTGEIVAGATGHLAGTAGDAVYDITFHGQDALQASVRHFTLHCEYDLLVSRAAGSGSLQLSDAEVTGTWHEPGEVIPRSPAGLSMTYDVFWVRSGASAQIGLRNVDAHVDVPGIGSVQIVDDATLRGAGTILPDDGTTASCDDPAEDATARITGSVAGAD